MTARGWYDPTLPPDIRRWVAEEGSALCTMVAAKWGKGGGVISNTNSNTRNKNHLAYNTPENLLFFF